MHCPGGQESLSLESFALDLGDCIGVESCVDLRSDLSVLEEEIISAASQSTKNHRGKGLGTMRMVMERDYPPPIPWLARTENLPSHMPWVMKRYIMDDGRLIIREEKVKRHEYFQAHRSNGRLTLRLVPLSDDDGDEVAENENAHADECGEVDGFVDVAAEVMTENQTEKEEESIPNPSPSESCREKFGGSGSGDGGGGGGECHKSVKRNSSMFGLTLPAFRPVHT